MKSENNPAELSYFRLSLIEFLHESHPELCTDERFISSRSEAACEAYEQAARDGYDHSGARTIANEVLFRGLHFSKHDTLVHILWNEFSDRIDPDRAKAFALTLQPECEAVFAKYPLSENFAYTPEFELMYTELTGTVSIYLQEHELQ